MRQDSGVSEQTVGYKGTARAALGAAGMSPSGPPQQTKFSGWFLALAFAIALYAGGGTNANASQEASEELIVKPYLQLGSNYNNGNANHYAIVLRWMVPNENQSRWTAEISDDGQGWQPLPAPAVRTVTTLPSKSLKLFTQPMNNLAGGQNFQYRLLKDTVPVFTSVAKAPKSNEQNARICIFGDCGDGSPAQKRIAFRVFKDKPDLVLIPGDIVYPSGRLGEYFPNFFDVYNNDRATATAGVPLLRSVLFVACPGNHDTSLQGRGETANLALFPDGLAYFTVFDQPLNGPVLSTKSSPRLGGSPEQIAAFLAAADHSYPQMANFSFDFSNAHIVCLDGDEYMDWQSDALQSWLDKDLSNAQNKTWKLVIFHQACFSSDQYHFEDQRMRLLTPIMERHGVNVVLCGHSHSYQRSCPLFFQPAATQPAPPQPSAGTGYIYGTFRFDKDFDGITQTKPNGIIYVVSGGGGGPLTDDPKTKNPRAWQAFTKVYRADKHSFTQLETGPNQLELTQIGEDGSVLDKIKITK